MPEETKNNDTELIIKGIEDIRKKQNEYEEAGKDYAKSSEFKTFQENLSKDVEEKTEKLRKGLESINDTIKKINLGSTKEENTLERKVELYEKYLKLNSLSPEDPRKKNFNFSEIELNEVKTYRSDVDDALGYFHGFPEFLRQIIDQNIREISPVERFATAISSSKSQVSIPTITEHGRAYWDDEGPPPLAEDSSIRAGRVDLIAHKIVAKYSQTVENIATPEFNLVELLRNNYIQAFEQSFGTAYILGNSPKRPQGLLYAPGVVRINSGDANNFTSDGLKKLFYNLKTFYARDAMFGARRLAILELSLLKDNDGRYYLQMLREGGRFSIMGVMLEEFPDMPLVVANAEPLILGSFRFYNVLNSTALDSFIIDPFSQKGSGIVEYQLTRAKGGMLTNPESFVIQKIAA